MINKFEISRKAKEFGLLSSTIEKDYVLGWMLIGIQNHPRTRDSWIFKVAHALKNVFLIGTDFRKIWTSLCWMLSK